MTQFFVDQNGNYLGGFDGVDPPEGAIEVPTAPDDARQKWSGSAWLPVIAVDEQIMNAPDDLTGGPTLGEIYGNG